MALDKIMIGARIRRIRTEMFEESQKEFAIRCDLEERHIGQLERGDFFPSLQTLDKIISNTGVSSDYILYNKGENKKFKIRETIKNILDSADNDELQMYYKCISTIKQYIKKIKM